MRFLVALNLDRGIDTLYRSDTFDGFVFVTPEYNRGISGALKNAIDFLFREWNNKAAGFVGCGSVGAARAVDQLRLVLAEVQIATVRNQVLLSLFTDFENFSVSKPAPRQEKSANAGIAGFETP
jgi:NAD(P)H-dependent FMN reductase